MADHDKSIGTSTQVSRVIKAPRKTVYEAFLDPDALASWLAPGTMKGHVHLFEPHEGGTFRMSLTYQDLTESPGGKSSEDTDTFQGTFAELVPNEKIVWITEFESQDPDFAGEMRLIWHFADVDGGTEVTVLCENIPRGIRPEDNEEGSRSSLQKLAALVES
jgi:uncharacterized protein YndB with AHSA1/START domain